MPLEFMPLDRCLDQELPFDGPAAGGFRRDRDGIMRDPQGYDEDGYDEDGYTREGYDREGYDSNGYDQNGYDEHGYDLHGYDESGYNENGYNEDGYDEDGELDYDGRGDYVDTSWLGNNPPFIFHSTAEEKAEAEAAGKYVKGKRLHHVPYYGMEIELTSDCNSRVREIVQEKYGQLVWGKVDSSVEGFEMCAHPMTARWAQENFPWQIVEELGAAGCEVWAESNGLHIHVSREGFENVSHQFRWVKFFYSIQDEISGRNGMAGRRAEEWGRFTDEARRQHFDAFLTRLSRQNGGTRESWHYLERYSALNLQNVKTIEARIFASTTSAEKLRMRFELMAATVEYTRHQTVKDIIAGGWEYNTFVRWLFNNEGTYPALERRCAPARTLD